MFKSLTLAIFSVALAGSLPAGVIYDAFSPGKTFQGPAYGSCGACPNENGRWGLSLKRRITSFLSTLRYQYVRGRPTATLVLANDSSGLPGSNIESTQSRD